MGDREGAGRMSVGVGLGRSGMREERGRTAAAMNWAGGGGGGNERGAAGRLSRVRAVGSGTR
jgi:hypothetical protein